MGSKGRCRNLCSKPRPPLGPRGGERLPGTIALHTGSLAPISVPSRMQRQSMKDRRKELIMQNKDTIMTHDVATRIQRLEDRNAIIDLVISYATLIDKGDWGGLRGRTDRPGLHRLL